MDINLIIRPDEEEIGAAEVFVDGSIGGRPYRFLLDTGAGSSSVMLDEYTSAFSPVDKHDSSGVFAKSSSDRIRIPDLTVGPLVKQDITIVRASEEGHARNLIGMDFLKDYCCHFLFDQDRVVINSDENASFQPLFLDKKYHPYVDVRFGTAKASAVWDTGASLTVVDVTFIKNHPDVFQEAGFSMGTDSTGTTIETPMFLMSGMTIGDHTFPPQRVAAVDLSFVNSTIEIPMDLILGYNTYKKANWIFDFPGKRWAISRWLG